MSGTWTDRAQALVAGWTRALVRGLPQETADDRIAEIASDLWEQQHAARTRGPRLAASIVLRLLRGVPADLLWRREVVRRTAPARTWVDRTRGVVMKHTRRSPIAKPWVPLTDVEKPFDQTNGTVDFDVPDKYDVTDVQADIVAKGVLLNTVNVGFFGGGMG